MLCWYVNFKIRITRFFMYVNLSTLPCFYAKYRRIHPLYFDFLVHNPYNEQVYLCVAMTKHLLLMQWYEPLEKFMKVKVKLMIKSFFYF